MAVETKYICDRCGAVQDAPGGMWSVMLYVELGVNPYMRQGQSPEKYALWCRQCVEKFGLARNVELSLEEVRANATLEDMIREIVREEIDG